MMKLLYDLNGFLQNGYSYIIARIQDNDRNVTGDRYVGMLSAHHDDHGHGYITLYKRPRLWDPAAVQA